VNRVRHSILFALALAWLDASSGFAHAQAAAPAAPSSSQTHADTLFDEGKTKLAEQNYAEACPLFAGSFAMDPATGTLLALALCHERAGEVKIAINEYRDTAERAAKEGRADRAQAASKRADELEAKLEPEPAAVPPPVLAKPKRKPAPIRPLPPPPEPRASGGLTTWQWIGVTTASAGVLTLGASAGFAAHAASLNDDSKDVCDGDLCTPEGRSTRLDAVSAGNVASAMALTGAVLVTTGAALFFSTGSNRSDDLALSPWVTENSAGAAASGRF
jgi:hypothetical protein